MGRRLEHNKSVRQQAVAGSAGAAGNARQGLGRTGERLAAEALVKRGYRILEQNFRCSYGEIDLIAEEGHDLVFVEVKTRRGQAYGLPEEAVTPRKARKLAERRLLS